jgi:hypothetical protein
MPTLLISGPAAAFAENPRARAPIGDRRTLARLHGLRTEDNLADDLDEPPLGGLGVAGGRLCVVLDETTEKLRVTTTYRVPRRLDADGLARLVEFTKGQWSDGSGSGSFENLQGTVLSTALAMAILNSEPGRDDLGQYFVDAFPMFADDSETHVEFLEADLPEKTDLDYLQEAAGFGSAQAQFQLARLVQTGEGLARDERRAVAYHEQAAAQGHLPALTFLGLCCMRGEGTAVDLERGAACFQQAAEGGYPLAMHCLGECYLEGRGVAKIPEQGIHWYERGVDVGDLGCTAQLADCYEYGLGVPQDLPKALDLYERCLAGGFDAVAEAVTRVKEQLGQA